MKLAERKNGRIPSHRDSSYIWGHAMFHWAKRNPKVRIVNLETSVTLSDVWESKGINYRCHPQNVSVLKTAGIDVCALANNHVLDWGVPGLLQTVQVLRETGIQVSGAGKNKEEAKTPAVVSVAEHLRVIVFSIAFASSGVPDVWAAQDSTPGVNYFREINQKAFEDIRAQIERFAQTGDIIVVSVHWGPNWGYEISHEQKDFAHRLIDEAHVDLIHGHSSHHPLGMEVYGEKLILYGCGDFINDYEGISGYEEFRGDISLMYFPSLDISTGRLKDLVVVPLVIKNLSLQKPSNNDIQWIQHRLNRECHDKGLYFKQDGEILQLLKS